MRNKSRVLAGFVLLAAALACWAPRVVAAQSTENATPRIDVVRVGVAGCYKIGHWTPVWVEASGITQFDDPRIEITVVDNDGVATTATAIPRRSSRSDSKWTAIAFTRVGRVGAPIRAVLADGDEAIDEVTLSARTESNHSSPMVELPPTGELIVSIGTTDIGLRQAFNDREAADRDPARRMVEIKQIADLPTEWFGYDAVDVLVISASDPGLVQQLAADELRFAALVQWVELGGRLVLLCGGEHATELLAADEPFGSLVPGRFDNVVRLTETGSLEQFAEPAGPIPGRGASAAISVPRLTDVIGHIEVYAGRRSIDLPLVVRAARGLGEVTFAGVELAKPPLADWSGRHLFLQALLRPYIVGNQLQDVSQTLVARGYDDLSGALRQRLGRNFASVTPIIFPVVAVLALAYLLVLGPLDYLLVLRWLGQPLAAWITFPLIVILFGTGALYLASWRTGTATARVNRVELVDIDMVTGQARGTFWAALYSPSAEKFDLAVNLDSLASTSGANTRTLLTWWGLPGSGIGGMQAHAANLAIVHEGYRYSRGLDALHGVPVVTASTKSLCARWNSKVAVPLEAKLADQDGIVVGSIVNKTGLPLRNARLFYQNWGYRLGTLADGESIDIGEQLEMRSVKTSLVTSALGTAGTGSGLSEGNVFVPERASVLELLNLMMFFEATGGAKFAQLPNRYQAYCDLSGLLKPGLARAILVAEASNCGSRLIDQSSGKPLGDDNDVAAIVYRFVISVSEVTRNDM